MKTLFSVKDFVSPTCAINPFQLEADSLKFVRLFSKVKVFFLDLHFCRMQRQLLEILWLVWVPGSSPPKKSSFLPSSNPNPLFCLYTIVVEVEHGTLFMIFFIQKCVANLPSFLFDITNVLTLLKAGIWQKWFISVIQCPELIQLHSTYWY